MKRLTDLVSAYLGLQKNKDTDLSQDSSIFEVHYSEHKEASAKLESPASPSALTTPVSPTSSITSPLKVQQLSSDPEPLIGATAENHDNHHIPHTNGNPNTDLTKEHVPTSTEQVQNADSLPTGNSLEKIGTPSPNKETFLKKAQQLKEKNESTISKLDDHMVAINARLCTIESTTTSLSTSILNLTEQVKTIHTSINILMSKADERTTNVTNQGVTIKNINETVKKVQSQTDKSTNRLETLTQNTCALTQVTNEAKGILQAIKKIRPNEPTNPADKKDNKTSTTQTELHTPITETLQPVQNQATGGSNHIVTPTEPQTTENTDFQIDDSDSYTTVNHKAHKKRPTKLNIEGTSKTVIVSDSMFRGMTPDMISPQTHITSIGGATLIELTEIIDNTQTCESVEYVYIHVGHNDSKTGPSEHTKQDVDRIIDIANRTFPKAIAYMSSVLPNRDNKNRTNIDAFNECIKAACSETDWLAVYIDLTDVMTSPNSNLPRKDFYRDPIHPSSKAISALAEQIKPLVTDTSDKNALKPKIPKPKPDTTDKNALKPKIPTPKPSPDGEPDKDTEKTDPDPKSKKPMLFHTKVVNEQGNVFQAHSATVKSREDVKHVLANLYSDPKLQNATSIMYCYRFEDPETHKILEDSVEDHEHAAGEHIMKHIRQNNALNVLVAVSREFSCHIHKLRWDIIEELTMQALLKLPNQPHKAQTYPWVPHERSTQSRFKPRSNHYRKHYQSHFNLQTQPERSWIQSQQNAYSHKYTYRHTPYSYPFSPQPVHNMNIAPPESPWNISPFNHRRPPLLQDPTPYQFHNRYLN